LVGLLRYQYRQAASWYCSPTTFFDRTREAIKRKSIEHRRLLHLQATA
jgi:hypothetical protein